VNARYAWIVLAGPARGPASMAALNISWISDMVSACERSATVFFGLSGVLVVEAWVDMCKLLDDGL